jgi:hypothetical protein
MRGFSSSSHHPLAARWEDSQVRVAIVALLFLAAVTAGGAAYEWRSPSLTEVPPIQLEPAAEPSPAERTNPKKPTRDRPRPGTTQEDGGGATPAPAPPPALAGDDDDGGDDDSGDGGDGGDD